MLFEKTAAIVVLCRGVGRMSSVSMIDGHIDKITNYERIRNMSVDEMAEYLNGIFDCCNCPNDMFLCESNGNVCTKYIKQWLESEAE